MIEETQGGTAPQPEASASAEPTSEDTVTTAVVDEPAAMTETQKVGYDGAFTFEITESGDPAQILTRAARVRARLADALITF